MKKLHFISRIVLLVLLTSSLLFSGFPIDYLLNTQLGPRDALAVNVKIRQEINIIDGYMYVPYSGGNVNSSAIILLDPARYSGATYYLEVVASTTYPVDATVQLINATSSVSVKSITVNGTAYARYRSTSFTAPTMATEYKVKVFNTPESVGVGIIAARIIILQDTATLSNTETQVEIGNNETGKSNTTSAALTYPKYWYYDSSKWDASPIFYAEVTYKIGQVASSTTYTTSGTRTYIASPGVSSTVVEAWGAGGAGGVGTAGGGGGGGGGYARSTTTPAVGSSHTLVIGASTASDSTTRNDSTYDTTTVVADGGAGSGTDAAGTGGTTNTGEVTFDGGNGGAADTGPDTSGGGGGAAGPGGNGAIGQGGQAAVGGGGGNANGVAGLQANGGDGAAGSAGTSAATGGKGGGGSDTSTNGGNGGAPGGGGGGSDAGTAGTGADGQIKLTEWIGSVGVALEEDNGSFGGWTFKQMIVTGGTAATSTRVRSTAFTPTTGRNYRLVASTTSSGATYDIYNAKIVVDQVGAPGVDDSYSESNQDSGDGSFGNSLVGAAQSFTSQGGTLDSAKFYVSGPGSTGTLRANLYAHSGTYGVSSIPTGAALATSDAVNLPIASGYSLVTFNFSGANRVSLTNGTNYVMTLEYPDFLGGSTVTVGLDASSPTHSGNYSNSGNGSSWNVVSGNDAIFYVYTTTGVITLLEPQYLLANTSLPEGFSDQLHDFDTKWDTTEWSSTNVYIHEANSVVGGAADIKLQNIAGTADVTGSTITNITERERSTLTMPASSDLDVFGISLPPGDYVHSSRILVQVDTTAIAASDPPSVTTSAASPVAATTATLNGSITDTGGDDATQSGFAYGTNSTLSTVIATSTLGGQSGTASFSNPLSGLDPSTTYFFRAYATNPNGTGYGSILQFTTSADVAPGPRSSVGRFMGKIFKIIGGRMILK